MDGSGRWWQAVAGSGMQWQAVAVGDRRQGKVNAVHTGGQSPMFRTVSVSFKKIAMFVSAFHVSSSQSPSTKFSYLFPSLMFQVLQISFNQIVMSVLAFYVASSPNLLPEDCSPSLLQADGHACPSLPCSEQAQCPSNELSCLFRPLMLRAIPISFGRFPCPSQPSML